MLIRVLFIQIGELMIEKSLYVIIFVYFASFWKKIMFWCCWRFSIILGTILAPTSLREWQVLEKKNSADFPKMEIIYGPKLWGKFFACAREVFHGYSIRVHNNRACMTRTVHFSLFRLVMWPGKWCTLPLIIGSILVLL